MIISEIATIAATIGALIGMFFYFARKAKLASLEKRAKNEDELAILIEAATNDEERKKYAKMLHDLRHPK